METYTTTTETCQGTGSYQEPFFGRGGFCELETPDDFQGWFGTNGLCRGFAEEAQQLTARQCEFREQCISANGECNPRTCIRAIRARAIKNDSKRGEEIKEIIIGRILSSSKLVGLNRY